MSPSRLKSIDWNIAQADGENTDSINHRPPLFFFILFFILIQPQLAVKLDIVLCQESALSAQVLDQLLEEAGLNSIVTPRIHGVPKYPPLTRDQFELWKAAWPTTFREDTNRYHSSCPLFSCLLPLVQFFYDAGRNREHWLIQQRIRILCTDIRKSRMKTKQQLWDTFSLCGAIQPRRHPKAR